MAASLRRRIATLKDRNKEIGRDLLPKMCQDVPGPDIDSRDP